MSDVIDRQNLMEQLNELCDKKCPYNEPTKAIGACCASCAIDDVIKIVQNLPSAEPRCIATIQLSQEQLDEAFEKVKADILSVKPMTGKWIGGELGECSVCGHKGCASDIWDRCKEYFCPNCGTRLEE